jgi:spermidine/putrescine transport system ATP-binding protein
MSVIANVAFGLRMRGVPKTARLKKAKAMLETVGLAHAQSKRPHELSGGQRQRVALARALVVEPAVLLLDEPLGALDLKLRRQMQDELKALQQRIGTAFVHVTHDQEEAMALADHVVVMNHGRIEDQGPPERVYGRPATIFTATFMGESVILPARARKAGFAETPIGTFAVEGLEHGAELRLAIRPEHIRTGDRIQATVREVLFQGSYKRVTATCRDAPGVALVSRLPPDAPYATGDAIGLDLDERMLVPLRD